MDDERKADPIGLFREWFAEAQKSEPNDPNAMMLASATPEGRPSARMVLLKDADERGFTFFTNYESRKGRELLANPQGALLFHWKSLRRQVRAVGRIETVSDAEADAYFATRARGSQIGAWASDQSRPLESRFVLEKKVAQFAAKFGLGKVPRPPHWSGFRLVPDEIEFWKDGTFRLHDRLMFHRTSDGWRTEQLYP
ncbi:MAG: pyridoxamine 5'-phosphate oxidase [Alphaproteobacteria bacterium]